MPHAFFPGGSGPSLYSNFTRGPTPKPLERKIPTLKLLGWSHFFPPLCNSLRGSGMSSPRFLKFIPHFQTGEKPIRRMKLFRPPFLLPVAGCP